MIIPAGKRRMQVNQGGSKHESIFDGSLFQGLLGKTAEETPSFSSAKTPEGQAMSQSNSSSMNPSRIPPEGEMKGKPAPGGVGAAAGADPAGADPAAAQQAAGAGDPSATGKDPKSILRQMLNSGQLDDDKARQLLQQVQQHDPNQIKNVVNQALRGVDQTGLLQALLQEQGDGNWTISISNKSKVGKGR
jgi:hypothetical protein